MYRDRFFPPLDFSPNGCKVNAGLELAGTAASATFPASAADFVRLVACWMAFVFTVESCGDCRLE